MTPRATDATVVAVTTTPVSPQVRPELVVRGARGTHDRSDFLLVRVLTSAGVEGFGEVSATLAWSGEDAGTAAHVMDAVLATAVVGQPLAPVARLAARMDAALAGSPFTKAGLSMALWDAWARTLDVPLAVALGGPLRVEVPVKCSLSGDGDRLAGTLVAARAAGFTSYKVKVGMDVDTDVRRVAQVRELVGADAFLGLDANGGYSRTDARRAAAAFLPYDPAFFEQPVHAADLVGMRELRATGLPVVADESVFVAADLVQLLRSDAADVLSLYVGKSSGLDRAVAMGRMADAFGLDVLLGSNGELGLGAAAQMHVACALPSLSTRIPSDIIGAHYYVDDVLAGPLASDGVTARLPDGPGLGVTLREDLLERLRAD